jgi:hypothetical protein
MATKEQGGSSRSRTLWVLICPLVVLCLIFGGGTAGQGQAPSVESLVRGGCDALPGCVAQGPPDGRSLWVAPQRESRVDPAVSAAGPLAQQTFYSTADACVLEGYPTANVGDTEDMLAGYDEYYEPNGEIVRSLVAFDIGGLPAGQTITKATLRLRLLSSWDYPATPRTITTYRATSGWSEMSVTWNNQPGYGEAYGSASILSEEFDWHELDVTSLVAAWYAGTETNHGIVVRGPEYSGTDSSWRAFSTKEGPYPPELVVEYGGAGNTPPVISGLPDQQVPVNGSQPGAIDLWAYASDAESPDSELMFAIDNAPASGAGVSISGNRYIDINPTTGWSGQTDVRIRVTDPGALWDTDTFRVTVGQPDDYKAYLPLLAKRWRPGLLFFDDFSDPGSGWYVGENEYTRVAYVGGEYQILVKQTSRGSLVTPDLVLPSDYGIEADCRQASDNSGSYGLVFGARFSGSSYELHEFLVHPDYQEYRLRRRSMDGSWTDLINPTGSTAIHPGHQTNRLRVERIGSQISLYINGTEVNTYTDANLTSAGRDAGVRAYSYDQVPVDMRFDNFAAYAN